MKILQGPDTAPHGQGNEYLLRCTLHHMDHGVPGITGGGDVQKNDLVRPLVRVEFCQLYRVSGIPDVDEVNALDHPSVPHVQAGNDSFG